MPRSGEGVIDEDSLTNLEDDNCLLDEDGNPFILEHDNICHWLDIAEKQCGQQPVVLDDPEGNDTPA